MKTPRLSFIADELENAIRNRTRDPRGSGDEVTAVPTYLVREAVSALRGCGTNSETEFTCGGGEIRAERQRAQ